MVTFVIPSIDRVTLSRTLQSLIAQSDPDWMAIVVYDGFYCSPPVTDPRILFTWFDPKVGTGNAAAAVRAKAFPLVRTEWIAFLDDDDTVHYDYVKTPRKYATQHSDATAFVFRMQDYGPEGRLIPPPEITSSADLRLGKVGISMSIRSTELKNNEWRSNWCEDWDLVRGMLERGSKIVLLPETMYRVRW